MSLSQIELVWVRVRMEWECFWVNLREDNKVSESKMAVSESNLAEVQDGCHHQVKWEWMSLSQIELVWVIVRMEWECFWVNLREDNKVSKSKMAVSESSMAEFKIAAIIKLSQNKWMKLSFCQMAESMMAEFKIAAIIKLSQNEWVKFFFVHNGWIKNGRFQDSCHHQVESEWMSEVFLCKCWELILASVSGFERKN